MSPIQGDLETGRPRLSTMSFIDPQHDADRQHVTVRATQPRPLPRELRLLQAEIPGPAARVTSTSGWPRPTPPR